MKKLLLILMLLPLFSHGQLVGKKDSQLDPATTLSPTDQVRILQGGVSKRAAVSLFSPLTTYVTQTSNYTLSDYTATDGVCQDWVITGNSTNTISVPTTMLNGLTKWQNGNGVTFDNTKVNYIYTCAKNGYIFYNTIKTGLPSGADVTAPTYSVQTVTGISSTAATFNAQINEAGTVKWMATTSATAPSKASILAGTGAVGSNYGSITIIAATTNTASLTSLTASTSYYLWSYAIDASANETAVQSGINFTTSAAGDVSPPTLSSPTATQTGSNTATLGVTTNEGNGTLYTVITTSATSPSAAQVKLGQNNSGTAAAYAGNQAASSTGAKTFSATGLTASTTYYSYFMHEDAAANQSTVSAASSFTTTTGLVAQDQFTATNSTDIVGRTTPIGGFAWARVDGAGTMGIVSNKLKLTSNAATTDAIYAFDAGVRNKDITATIGATPAVAGQSGFFPVYTDVSNYILITTGYNIIIRSGGSSSTAYTGSGAWTAGDVIRVVIGANSVQLYRNGTNLSGTLGVGSGVTGTKVAFQLYQEGTCSFDDITF